MMRLNLVSEIHSIYQLSFPKKRLKSFIVSLVFFILGRVLVSTSNFDKMIKEELITWPENFILLYKVYPEGPELALQVVNGRFKKIKNLKINKGDLTLYIKGINTAFRLTTCQLNTVQGFSEKRAFARGDIPTALSLIRCLNIVQRYLYPSFLAKRMIKRLPRIPWYQRYYGRLRILLIGIPFGY